METDDTILHFSRELAMKTTVATAVVYNVLDYRKKHFDEQLNEDGEFWSSIASIAEYTGFTERTVMSAVATLEELGLVERRASYRPGTTTKTTFWKVHILKKFQGGNPEKSSVSILKNGKKKIESGVEDEEDVIPLTQQDVRAWLYDTDENGKTIAVEHIIPRRDWNKAVRKWREDESASVLVTLKDTGSTERMTFKRIKKFNVRSSNGPRYDGEACEYAK